MSSMRSALIAILLLVTVPAVASADRLLPLSPAGPTFQSTGAELVAFDGYVYLAANNGVVGNELWRTDGTPAGTTLVADLNVGNAATSSNPRDLMVVGTRLYFVATDGAAAPRVYTIDPGGTPQVTTTDGGSPATGGALIGAVNGKALLIHYDGAANKLFSLGQTGTIFQTVTPAAGTNVSVQPAATVGGFAYFGMTVNSNSATEPYRTDGATAQMVKDIVPGVNGSQPTDFVATGNRAYFTADDGTHGRELFVTDGSDPGTQLVHEHHPLNVGSSISNQTPSGDVLYYVPNDQTTGGEVWRTEGTEATTRVVKDITPGANGSGQYKLFRYGSGFGMFRGSDIYASDGTAAGTTLLSTVDLDGLGPAFPVVVGSRVYFRGGFSPYGSVMWRSDGTPAGTFGLTAGAFDGLTTGGPDAGPSAALGSKVIFTGLYPHAAGDPVPASARRIYTLDTSQADETRQAAVAPSISGTPAAGQNLTGDKGTWTREPNRYAYAWLRNGTPVPNATTTTYTPSTADNGAQIAFRVTASGIGGPNVVSAVSAPVVVGGTPSAGTPPGTTPGVTPAAPTLPKLTLRRKAKLTGTARVGRRIKLTRPTFKQAKVKIALRWYANGKRIKRQTKSSLRLVKSYKGKRITVKIVATKTGYRSTTMTLRLKGKVKAR